MIANASTLNKEFSRWLNSHGGSTSNSNAPRFSIAIESPCHVCQPRVAADLAKYLNEFDEASDGTTWLYVNDHRLEQLQATNDFRRAVQPKDPEDLANAIDFLSSKGSVILEFPDCHRESPESEYVFQVRLSCAEPTASNHHLWLNAKRISPDTLTLMIANSFIDWASRGGDLH